MRLGLHVRVGCSYLIYKKSLKLGQFESSQKTMGKMVSFWQNIRLYRGGGGRCVAHRAGIAHVDSKLIGHIVVVVVVVSLSGYKVVLAALSI